MSVRSRPGPLVQFWACRLTGRRSACTRQMRVQLPPRSTVDEWPGGGMADTRSSEGRAHRGVRVQVPPWSLTVVALVVKGTSWLPPKEQVQVRFLAGVLLVASMVKGRSRGSAKAEFLVRV